MFDIICWTEDAVPKFVDVVISVAKLLSTLLGDLPHDGKLPSEGSLSGLISFYLTIQKLCLHPAK